MNRLVQAILSLCLMVGMTAPVGGAGRTCAEFHAPLSAPDAVHIYLYAHGNPVNMVDPSGHFGIGSVSLGSSLSSSLGSIYNGTVVGVGNALQATIFGVQAGKGVSEILSDFILDETGLSLAVDGYNALRGYFQDEEAATLVAYQAWQEEVLAAVVMSLGDSASGEYEIEFVPQCFVAGTLVATETGLKPIEEIRVGDKVWAWNESNDEVTLRPVLDRFVHRRNEIFEIQVGRDTLKVTGEHPFYILGRGWTATRSIEVGDQFVTEGNCSLAVEHVGKQQGDFLVYNFEVSEDHNYYVGDEGLLTHNVSAAQMRRTLGIQSHPFLAAHHIVARFARNADNQASIRILQSVGISLEHGANGVALPRNLTARPKSGKFAVYSAHSVIHSARYYENVRIELEKALALGGRKQVRLQLQSIGNRLRFGVFPH